VRNILIVDDDLAQAKFFGKYITQMNHNVIYIDKGQEAIDFFVNKKPIHNVSPHEVDVLLLDMSMPDVDGIEVLRRIAPVKENLQVIVLTAGGEIGLAITAMSFGAVDYIVKGEKDVFARIVTSVGNAIEKRNLKYQISFSERTDGGQVMFSDLVGSSAVFVNAINSARKVSNSTVPVLIEGQVGTGKEFLAKAIHGSSIRSETPFVSVDCAKLNSTTADETLFGFKKILENGVVDKSIGKIRKANNGTLFLNNVDALPLETQIKLLHFIQEGEITPVGSKVVTGINIRIISATSSNLRVLSKKGKFKEDLYYCLSVFLIQLPSLRERGYEDIKALAENFCYNFNISENKRVKGLTEEALKFLAQRNWEGNIRQLRNYVFRAVILCDDKFLEPKHFPKISELEYEEINRGLNGESSFELSEYDNKSVELFDNNGKCKNWSKISQEVVQQLFDVYNGNLSEMSKNLKISRSTIYRKLNIVK
jgi:DNA-binding NtrC family response regulator